MARASNIILVHGAWADGSSWSKVIPLLRPRGLKVTAVQLPLTSFDADIATVKRAIALEGGPIILARSSSGPEDFHLRALVGHSYGGAIITEAGNDAKVVGLVYIAAFAPNAGQSAFSPLRGPAAGASLGGNVTSPAWKTKPSWYVVASSDRAILVASSDRAIQPTLQRTMAKAIKATTIEVAASHVAMLSKPEEVAKLIENATTA